MTAISGNGSYILARLPDYPITPELTKVKKRLLKLIADEFSTERVKIDEKVFNPSRLMCALGTLKMKGDPTEDRPHRPSHIWRVAGATFDPKEPQKVVPFNLYTLAEGWLEPVAEVKATLPTHNSIFDIREHARSLPGYHETDRGWAYGKCPAHNGNGNTSFQVNLVTGAYRCAAECTSDRIREALGVSARHLVEGVEEMRLPSVSWPAPPTSEALHGLAGDIVRTISPHSEADGAALLLQFLVAFGNAIGRSAHFRAEADEHYEKGS